jgi:hypothetical protein
MTGPIWKVGLHTFPFVNDFNHGDAPLIREVTGLTWNEFSTIWSTWDPEAPDPLVGTALLAVAVQHAQPTWSRQRVNDFVRNLPIGATEFIAPETNTPAADDPDANPEEVARTVIPPSDSSASSNSSDAASSTPEESPPENSATQSQSVSVDPGSSTTIPDLRQVV